MLVNVKFKGIKYGTGKSVSFVKKIECPEFTEIDITENLVKLFGKEILEHVGHTTSVNDQVMEWLDNQDKMYIIHEHDLQCILNYEVVEQKSIKAISIAKKEEKRLAKEQLLSLVLNELDFSEELKITFNYAYQTVKDKIKDLSIPDQISLVFSMLDLGMKASTAAYQHILDIYKGFDEKRNTETLKLD